MLNHSCPGSVLREGQALRNSNLGTGIRILIIQQFLYSLLGMCAPSSSQGPLLTKVPVSSALILLLLLLELCDNTS